MDSPSPLSASAPPRAPALPTDGAAEMRARLDHLQRVLADNIAEMARLMTPSGTRDKARLNHLLLETSHAVHAGHRLMADSGKLRAADIAAAGQDPGAQAAVHAAWNALTLETNRLRLDLAKWPQVETMLRPQVRRRRRPLVEPLETLPPTARTREAVSDMLFAQLHHLLNRETQDPDAYDHGYFSDIRLAQSLFLRDVHAAKRCLAVLKPGLQTRFLDVGCGAGLKVISAAPYFDRACGLEYDSGYVRLARSLFAHLPHDRCRVIAGDALTWQGYDDYDAIYFFRPLRDDDRLAQMERHILAQVPAGTLILGPYRMFEARAAEHGCAHVAGNVWLSGSTEAQARRLRRAAEMIGTDVQLTPDSNVPLIWDPLIRAARLNGFEPSLSHLRPLQDDNA